jgi:hypothetical protein
MEAWWEHIGNIKIQKNHPSSEKENWTSILNCVSQPFFFFLAESSILGSICLTEFLNPIPTYGQWDHMSSEIIYKKKAVKYIWLTYSKQSEE